MYRSNTVGMAHYKNLVGYQQKVAHHEAGHAAAVHLNNGVNNLPPVFFQIIFKNIDKNLASNTLIGQKDCIAKIKGGRLLQSLHPEFYELNLQLSSDNDEIEEQIKNDYRLAFEADIVNLLIGPLAEAKFSYQMDDEPFNEKLITPQALENYGGYEDLIVVKDYLHSYSVDQEQQNEILNQLFIRAFDFINDHANWKAITRLANYILTSNKEIISCEEVAVVLEEAI